MVFTNVNRGQLRMALNRLVDKQHHLVNSARIATPILITHNCVVNLVQI
jgi:hypothetical protein